MTNLAEAILEDKMGYEVESKAADVACLHHWQAAILTFSDCWLL